MSPDRPKKGDTRPVRKSRRPRRTQLQRAVQGAQAIDRRTTLGKALARWRMDLIQELGGIAVVTASELALVDLAARTKLVLDSVDAWLLQQPTLVHARKGTLLPVVLQRQQLADSLARYLGFLGRLRKTRPRAAASLPASGGGHAPKPVSPSGLSPEAQAILSDQTPEARTSRDKIREFLDGVIQAVNAVAAAKTKAKETKEPEPG